MSVHTMRACGGADLQLHPFSIMELDGGSGQPKDPSAFSAKKVPQRPTYY
jgi:hypothetical protein